MAWPLWPQINPGRRPNTSPPLLYLRKEKKETKGTRNIPEEKGAAASPIYTATQGKNTRETSLLPRRAQRPWGGSGGLQQGNMACRGHRLLPGWHRRLAGRSQDGRGAGQQQESPNLLLSQQERGGGGTGGGRAAIGTSWGRSWRVPWGNRVGGALALQGSPNY